MKSLVATIILIILVLAGILIYKRSEAPVVSEVESGIKAEEEPVNTPLEVEETASTTATSTTATTTKSDE